MNTGHINTIKHVPGSCNLDLSNAPKNARNGPVWKIKLSTQQVTCTHAGTWPVDTDHPWEFIHMIPGINFLFKNTCRFTRGVPYIPLTSPLPWHGSLRHRPQNFIWRVDISTWPLCHYAYWWQSSGTLHAYSCWWRFGDYQFTISVYVVFEDPHQPINDCRPWMLL